ncbi:MAG: TetR family transcriptional regulator [Rhodospirillales bacterium]|nr:TetR family transcriptional regulator [Rhodospirillales bacterium]
MAARRQPAETKRRIPRQARATETAAAILEGAAQILEAGGLAGFTTNAVAERAGVSIGTLYQYFADKNAILLALAKQQVELGLAEIARALRGEIDPTPAGRVRAMVRAAVHAFRGRQRARKAVMEAVLTQGLHAELMVPVVAFIARHGALVGATSRPVFAMLTPLQLFVMSRAMIGVLRAAVLEEQPFFKSRPFEDELVRLVMAYLQATTAEARA